MKSLNKKLIVMRDKCIMLFPSLLVILFSLNSFSQNKKLKLPIDTISGKITYTDIIHFDKSIDKEELYSRAKKWIAYKFSSNKTSSIQLDDKANGELIFKTSVASFQRSLGLNYYTGDIEFSIAIFIKQNRYKYIITEFNHIGYMSDNANLLRPAQGPCDNMLKYKKHRKYYEHMLFQLDSEVKDLAEELKTAMNGTNINTKNENW